MLFVAGMDMRYLGYAVLASDPAAVLGCLFRVAFRRERMLAFLDPYADPLGTGFHMIQSLIAVGTGGITGQGLMEGKQKLFYLPEPHTDFIFAVTAEELGLVGSVFIVVLFTIFLYRGVRAAMLHGGHLRTPAGHRHYCHGRGAGVFQCQRGARPIAHQGHSAAVHLVRRILAFYHPGQRRRASEHHTTSGLICGLFWQVVEPAGTSFRRWQLRRS